MTTDLDGPLDPYTEGYHDALQSKGSESCPYKMCSSRWLKWHAGHYVGCQVMAMILEYCMYLEMMGDKNDS